MGKIQGSETKFAVMAKDIEFIRQEVTEIKGRIDGHFVTREEFDPVKKVVYGMVGLILVAVAGALIALVVKK